MNEQDARRIAEAELTRWNDALQPDKRADPHATAHDPGQEVVVTHIDTHQRAWIVHFATRRWLETRHFTDMLVGACPLVVDRATGALHVYGSSPDEHARFETWLDVPTA